MSVKNNRINWSYYDMMNPGQAISKWIAKGNFSMSYLRYIHDIVGLKTSLFAYEGLEEVVVNATSDILESNLMFKRQLCFYNSLALGGWVLCTYTTNTNKEVSYFTKPKTVNIQTADGITIKYDVPFEDIIVIKDNFFDIPPIVTTLAYIDRIVNVEEKMDKVLINATMPIFLQGDKKAATQFKILAEKIGNNEPFVITDDSLTKDGIRPFPIDVPVSPNELFDLKQLITDEALASLGIYARQDKSERMLVSEVQSNNNYTDYQYQQAYLNRKRAIDELNRRSGANIEIIEVKVKSIEKEADFDYMETLAVASAQQDALPKKEESEVKNEEEVTVDED